MKPVIIDNLSELLDKVEQYIHILFEGMKSWYDQGSFHLVKSPQGLTMIPEVLKPLSQQLDMDDIPMSYGRGMSYYKIIDGYIKDDHVDETLNFRSNIELSVFFHIGHYTAESIFKYPKI